MKKNVPVIVLLLTILIQPLRAQNASKVFVIKEGQSIEMTLEGESDFSFFDQLHVVENGKKTSYDPNQIDGFRFENGRYFLSKKVRGTEERYFFQVPFEGEKSLGVLRSGYYLILGDEAIILSVESRENTNMVSREQKRKTYLGILHYAMDDCNPEITEMINDVNLSYPSLEKLFIAYHSCKNLPYQVHAETIPFFKLGVSASVGLGILNQRMSSLVFENQSGVPTFEILADLIFQKFSPRTKVQLGVSSLSFEDTWSVEDVNFNPGDERLWYQEEFKLNIIKLPAIINYNFLHKETQSLYGGVGLTYSLVKKESISEVSQWEYYSPYSTDQIITRPRDPVLLDQSNTFGFIMKAGYKKKFNSIWAFAEVQFDNFSNLGYAVLNSSNPSKYSMSMNIFKIGLGF